MPALRRTTDLTFIVAGLTLMVVLSVASFVLAPEDGAPAHSGSSFASHPAGAKGAFVFLQEAGYNVRRSLEPLTAIDTPPARTVLVLADPLEAPSQQDLAALKQFVEAGGTILAAGPTGIRFMPGLAAGDRARSLENARTYAPAFPSPLTGGAPAIEMAPIAPGIRADTGSWIPIYGDFDDPAVLTSRVGSGRLVWWASSGPLSNAGIQKPGHLDLLASVLGPRTDRVILWDEHYHGYTRSLWSYAAGTPVIWGLAQAGLAGALALFTFARRHGPIRHRVTEPRTSPLEFIETMGGLYERAQPSEAAAATARLRVRRMLQSRTGLTASSSDDEVASAVAAKFGMDAKTVKALLARSAAAGRSGASTGDALEVVAGLQRLAAEVAASGHHAGPGGRQSAESAAADRSDR